MKIENDPFENAIAQRKRAEEVFQGRVALLPENPESLSPEHYSSTLHELQIHQLELEMQNEELRAAQLALQDARERYFDLYDLAPVGYCTLSESGVILESNLTAATLLGANRSALVNQPIMKFIVPEDQDLYYLHRRKVFETGSPQALEIRIFRADGAPLWIGLEATLAKNAESPSVCRLAMIDVSRRKLAETVLTQSRQELEQRVAERTSQLRLVNEELHDEIAQRKRTESQRLLALEAFQRSEARYLSIIRDQAIVQQALQASEARYRAMIQDHSDFVCRFRKDGRITGANRSMAQLAGLETEEQLVGLNFFDLLPNEASLQNTLSIMQSITSDNPMREHVQHFHGDKEICVEWRSRGIFDDAGQVLEIQSVGRDITERLRAEAEKEKADAQNRQLQKSESLGRMAGAVAHRFNNQLQVIVGGLEMALRDPSLMPPRSVEFLSLAMQATRRASELSSLMLTYLGQTRDKREPLDLADACRRNLALLEASLPKNMVLKSALPFPGPSIRANLDQLQQVLTNLVTNAWDAANQAQALVAVSVKAASRSDISEVHRFPIDAQTSQEGYACLEVTDTGSGIAEEEIEKLFDPFYSSRFAGRGMGLSVVLGIVRAHKGVITVESEAGRGSTFRVYFPLTKDDVPRLPAKFSLIVEVQRSGTVLLVDDEDMIREVAAAMLRGLGFTVLAAKDGVEAVEVFRQAEGKIRWVLCDLSMPRMNGWETLTALRRLVPRIPVILASGYSEAQVMEGEHPELPQAFLNKPYRREQLCEAIHLALAEASGP